MHSCFYGDGVHCHKQCVYELEKLQYNNTEGSITKTLELIEQGFEGKDDEYLKKLTFLALLGYDIYLKKKFMENIIDDMAKHMAKDEEEKSAKEKPGKDKAVKEKIAGLNKTEAAKVVGAVAAERAMAKGVQAVVFDRGGYLYTGRVKAVADGAREAGLKF